MTPSRTDRKKKTIPQQTERKERLPEWKMRSYLKQGLMFSIKIPFWLLQFFLSFLKVKPDRIVLYSLKQTGYAGNLKYITEYIQTQEPGRFQLLWVVKNDRNVKLLKKRNIPAVKVHSLQHFIYRHTAGIVMTDDEFYPPCIRRKKQVFVNVWHGGINYKKIGFSGLFFTNPFQKMLYRLLNPCPDIFVSGSRSFTESASKAFLFPQKVFAPIGLPRNDRLWKEHSWIYRKLREKLRLPADCRLVLYAPTFRNHFMAPSVHFDTGLLKAALRDRFGGNWEVLVRQHYFVKNHTAGQGLYDVSEYEDMQELLCASDCLISDYSSCMWDYSFLLRPCFMLAEDMEEYRDTSRSFSIPITRWPYPVCRTGEELYAAIRTFNEEDYKKRVKCHHEEMGSFENARSSALLIEEIRKLTG
jgi:CDP-glycerol glycerophosphotransferase